MIDLAAIEARAKKAMGVTLGGLKWTDLDTVLYTDIPTLVAEVRRLWAEKVATGEADDERRMYGQLGPEV